MTQPTDPRRTAHRAGRTDPDAGERRVRGDLGGRRGQRRPLHRAAGGGVPGLPVPTVMAAIIGRRPRRDALVVGGGHPSRRQGLISVATRRPGRWTWERWTRSTCTSTCQRPCARRAVPRNGSRRCRSTSGPRMSRRTPCRASPSTTAQRRMAAVMFGVDTGPTATRPGSPATRRSPRLAAEHADVLIPFASVDPPGRRRGGPQARRLVDGAGVRGFKFHPNIQGFFPNDRVVYPLYEVIRSTGRSRSSTRPDRHRRGDAGRGRHPAEVPNPMHVDDVAVDFPDLRIILAHPSFPWQDEALVGRHCTSPACTSTCPAGRRSTSRRSSCSTRTHCSRRRCCSGPTSRSSPPTGGWPISTAPRSASRCGH